MGYKRLHFTLRLCDKASVLCPAARSLPLYHVPRFKLHGRSCHSPSRITYLPKQHPPPSIPISHPRRRPGGSATTDELPPNPDPRRDDDLMPPPQIVKVVGTCLWGPTPTPPPQTLCHDPLLPPDPPLRLLNLNSYYSVPHEETVNSLYTALLLIQPWPVQLNREVLTHFLLD